MMTNGKLNIAVVGLGVGLSAHVPALRAAGFNVLALASRNSEDAAKAAAEHSVKLYCSDVDQLLELPGLSAVAIATPPPTHHDFVIKAIQAGKHVLVEKELAVSAEQAYEMYEVAQSSNTTSMVAHAYRFAPSRAYVGKLIETGFIGKPHQIAIHFFWGTPEKTEHPREHWRSRYATGGGQSGGQLATFFDAVQTWFGDVSSIGGRVRVARPGRHLANGEVADADDTLSATFETASGVLGSITVGADAPFGQGGRIEIFGDEGSLVINQPFIVPSDADEVYGAKYGRSGGLQKLTIPGEYSAATDKATPGHPMLSAYWPLAQAFKNGIETGSSPSPNFFDSYKLQRISEALRESSAGGKFIDLPTLQPLKRE